MSLKIKEKRESIGMSQTELAKRAGVSRGLIWILETNPEATTTTKTLAKIASALGTTVGGIFFADDAQSTEHKRKRK